MIAHNPLHGSGQAGFPHPALALGEDADAMQGIGMTDRRRRQPASDEAPHAMPKHAAFVATPRKRAMPEPPYLEPKNPQRVLVLRHTVIPDVPTYHRLQPLAYFGDGFMQSSLKLGFHLVQLRLQPFANRESWRAGGWETNPCGGRDAPRRKCFAAFGERLSSLRIRSVGPSMASEARAWRCDRGAIRGRHRDGLSQQSGCRSVPGGTYRANAKVQSGIASREDATSGVRSVCN